MNEFFQSPLWRFVWGTTAGLVLLLLALPCALFALINLAVAFAIAGFGYFINFVHMELPDYNGAVPVDVFGMPPAVYVIIQSLALGAALLLLVNPIVVAVAIAVPLRRLLIGASISGVVLQAAATLILLSNTYLKFTLNDQLSNPAVWGITIASLYIVLACWGIACSFSSRPQGAMPTPLPAERTTGP